LLLVMLKRKVESSNPFEENMSNKKQGYWRARKVIGSCKTIVQLRTAKKYADLAIKDYLRRDGCFGTVWELRDDLHELIVAQLGEVVN